MSTRHPDDFSDDVFLGGRLRLRQPLAGHRAGHDAVLLGAATAADPGNLVVEFGAGVGAAALVLAARIGRIDLVLVEIDPMLAQFAAENARFNGVGYARVETLDVTASAKAFAAAGLGPASADVVMMNPPFNDPARHRASPDARRGRAHVAQATTLEAWIHAARRILRPGGTLTMIWRADGLADVFATLARGFGGIAVMPVFSKPGTAAIRVLVRATKGSRAPSAYYPGITLADEAGTPGAEFDRVARGEAPLGFGSEESKRTPSFGGFLEGYAVPDSPSDAGFWET
jgi:tRNA1(Val) A37 N6-methylase TrmN6